MSHLRATKAQLRAEFLARRRAMPPEAWREKSDQIAARLIALPEVDAATRVLCYVSGKDNEVNTLPLIKRFLADGKAVGLPRSLAGGKLEWRLLSSLEQLSPGAFGIPEPSPALTPLFEFPQTADICLVPGIAWDQTGYRIGYGKGFYDRFLCSFAGLSMGLAFDAQVTDKLPRESHDRAVMALVTESGVRRC
ncbi:MAG: hypothetical protein RLZZ303_305 [Candidatus Hydrogenedentota bacterium]|jgi:5-formyltetrahydrofolate cyclo-ligase